MRLIDELNELHDHYAAKIEAADRPRRDRGRRAARPGPTRTTPILLMAEREGLTHLLPLQRPAPARGSLHRLVAAPASQPRRLTRRVPARLT